MAGERRLRTAGDVPRPRRGVLPARGSFFFWRRKRRTKKKTCPGPKKPWDFFGLPGGGASARGYRLFCGVPRAVLPRNRRNGGGPGHLALLFCCRRLALPEESGAVAKREAGCVRNHLPGAKATKRGGKPKRPPSHGASRMEAAGSPHKVSQRVRDPQNDPKRSFWDCPSAVSFGPCTARFLCQEQRKRGVHPLRPVRLQKRPALRKGAPVRSFIPGKRRCR